MWLAGYSRDSVSAGVHDDIWARAIAIDDGERTFILATADLIGLLQPDVDAIRDSLVADGFDRDYVVVASTHNHSGPDVIGLWNVDRGKSGVDFDYLENTRRGIVAAARQAAANLAPARMTVSRNEVRGISKNHRDPDVLDYEVVTVLAVDGEGNGIATLVNFACHPEVLNKHNRLVTSDMAHYFYERMEAKAGGVALWVNGALGGMVSPLVSERTFAEAERCGFALADSAVSGFRDARPVTGEVRSIRKRVDLPLENPAFTALSQAGVIHRAIGDTVMTEVGVVRIGAVTAVTVPGELLPKPGFALKEAIGAPHGMVWGLVNDELGYLIASEDWQPNEYEESMSVGREAADIVVREIVGLLGATR